LDGEPEVAFREGQPKKEKLKTMKKQLSIVGLAAFALAATWGVSPARASTTFTIGDGGLETFNLTWDGTTENALAGGILLTHVSGPTPTFTSVCADIGGTVYLGQNYTYSDGAVFNGQGGIRPSWGAGNAGIALDTPWTSLTAGQQADASAAINAAAGIFYQHGSVLTTGTITQRAALQLAVWAALYDTAAGGTVYDLDNSANHGRFYVSSGDVDARALAETWLAELTGVRYAGDLLIPEDHTAQEMLYQVTPVPEPTTLIAGALLLLPFGASTLPILRKHRTA
jgi:hypothetical protein